MGSWPEMKGKMIRESFRYDTKRIAVYDVMRAICILWIAGVWHMGNYVKQVSGFVLSSDISYHITDGVLAAFTLLSSLIQKSKLDGKDVNASVRYLVRRGIYLYPLFALACMLFTVMGTYPLKWGLAYLSMLGIFTYRAPATLWYINMIFVFTAFGAVILTSGLKQSRIILIICTEALFVILHYLTRADIRLAFYWLFYSIPFLADIRIDPSETLLYTVLLIVSSTLLVSVTLQRCFVVKNDYSVVSFIDSGLVMTAIVGAAVLLSKSGIASYILGLIGKNSLFIYLFHRPVRSVNKDSEN